MTRAPRRRPPGSPPAVAHACATQHRAPRRPPPRCGRSVLADVALRHSAKHFQALTDAHQSLIDLCTSCIEAEERRIMLLHHLRGPCGRARGALWRRPPVPPGVAPRVALGAARAASQPLRSAAKPCPAVVVSRLARRPPKPVKPKVPTQAQGCATEWSRASHLRRRRWLHILPCSVRRGRGRSATSGCSSRSRVIDTPRVVVRDPRR